MRSYGTISMGSNVANNQSGKIRGIIIPRIIGSDCYRAPYTCLKVQYYAPGCYRVLEKIGESKSYINARAMLQAAKTREATCNLKRENG